MFDCANVEMRELLPELAAGTLDAATRARVEAHVAECTECAAELETLRLVRAAFSNAPAVDARRIVAALPKQPAAVSAHGASSAPVRRWMDWRIAAALTMITVGGLSVAVTQRGGTDVDRTTAHPLPESTVVVNATPRTQSDSERVAPRAPATTRAPAARPEKPQLSFGGGVDDLDRASIEALMGALDEIERAPVAPSAEPDRVPVLPIITGDTR